MSNSEPPLAIEQKMEIEIGLNEAGTHFVLSVPVATGKLACYGACEILRDEISKTFYVMERKAQEEKMKAGSLLGKLRLPGMRGHS